MTEQQMKFRDEEVSCRKCGGRNVIINKDGLCKFCRSLFKWLKKS